MTDTTAWFDVERYLNVRRASGGSLGPDGRLAFRMDTTGVPQVWTVDGPLDWPDQRTVSDERVTVVDYSPTRPELVYGTDEGGNERVQLFRLDPDGGPPVPLTDTPDAKHRWGGWSPSGDRFAFASNRRDPAAFDVFVQGRDDRTAERVHETDGWIGVAGWSPGGDRLALVRSVSSYDQDVLVLDLDDGSAEQLTTPAAAARHTSVEWGPGGQLYCCTDHASDTRRLERLAVDGTYDVVADGDGADVDGLAIAPSTGRIAYTRNVEGYAELTVGRLSTGSDDDPTVAPTVVGASVADLPEGVAGGLSWGPDGERLVCSASSRTATTNVYVVDASGTARQWTRAGTAGIPSETFVAPESVRYETFDDRSIPAYLSLPSDDPPAAADDGAADGVPAVVSVHGGPESQRRPAFRAVTQYLLARGYAVFEPNVRGSAGYGRSYASLDDVERRMDAVADLNAGWEWLAERPAVDPDRIAVMGGSYGGFMTLAALTTEPSRWAAGVDVVGIANFVTFLENTGDWRRDLREAEYGSLDEDRELLESISPINRLDRIDAPLFVIHGENDPRVPVGEAHQVADAAREQGVPVRKLVFDDEGHGISKLPNRVEAYSAVVDFLDEHVRGGGAADS